MYVDDNYLLRRIIEKICALVIISATLICMLPVCSIAQGDRYDVAGKLFEFGQKSSYDYQNAESFKITSPDNTYGSFRIAGAVGGINEKNGVPSYEVKDGNLDFYYNYGAELLNAGKDQWHLVSDKSKKVADFKLRSNILRGAIILMTSKDQNNWVKTVEISDAFGKTPERTDSIYSTNDLQLINGCYYRIIVVYQLSIRTKKRDFLGIRTDKYDSKKYAEVYEFYAYTNSEGSSAADNGNTYSLGTKVRTKNFDGYFGESIIDKKDVHYGWDIGNFFVSGYTDKVSDADGNAVFLKNVGDKVTLWFNLSQNINRLNDKKNLSVTADTAGHDQYFETPKMNFGKGVLIIRYTDYNNVKSDPIIYTNYLEASAVAGADTKVQLFEEGDYEVALDYQITKDELFDKISHYRIFFKFSVRNGNSV